MADEARLNDLKLRWEQDPGSRLFLQLADEYRKLGRIAEASEVLEKGLEKRPNDLSGLVALGRCRLEIENLDGAAEILETVITRDATHLVGNKLLLETYLRMGDADRAGERLDLYRVLNDRDPELEHLEYRLRGLREAIPGGALPAAVPPAASGPAAVPSPPVAPVPEPVYEPVSTAPPAPVPIAPPPSPLETVQMGHPAVPVGFEPPPSPLETVQMHDSADSPEAPSGPSVVESVSAGVSPPVPETEPSAFEPSPPVELPTAETVPTAMPPVSLSPEPVEDEAGVSFEMVAEEEPLDLPPDPDEDLGVELEMVGEGGAEQDDVELEMVDEEPLDLAPEPEDEEGGVELEIVDDETADSLPAEPVTEEAVVQVLEVSGFPLEPSFEVGPEEPETARETEEMDVSESLAAARSPAPAEPAAPGPPAAAPTLSSGTALISSSPEDLFDLSGPIPDEPDLTTLWSTSAGPPLPIGPPRAEEEILVEEAPLADVEESVAVEESVMAAPGPAAPEPAAPEPAAPEPAAPEPAAPEIEPEASSFLPEIAESVPGEAIEGVSIEEMSPEGVAIEDISVEERSAVDLPIEAVPFEEGASAAEAEITEPESVGGSESILEVEEAAPEMAEPSTPGFLPEPEPELGTEAPGVTEPIPLAAEPPTSEPPTSEPPTAEPISPDFELEPEPVVPATAPEPAADLFEVEPASVEMPVETPAEEPDETPPEVLPEVPEGGPATATLGELYLEQGHFEEAEKIFRRVLDRDPDHQAAQAGLQRALGRRGVTAPQLLATYARDSVIPEGLTAKKALVLSSYLKHLRGGGQDHVR